MLIERNQQVTRKFESLVKRLREINDRNPSPPMNRNLSNIEINILGRHYLVACEPEEEQNLHERPAT